MFCGKRKIKFLRLQSALSAEAADNYAQVAHAQQRLASVEQFASIKLAQAEEALNTEASERRIIAERAEMAMLQAHEQRQLVETRAAQFA